MTAPASAAFLGTVASALERMAFVVLEPAAVAPRELLLQCPHRAVVELRGEAAAGGAVLVAAGAGVLREFVAGLLGLDAGEVDLDEHGAAAVQELANVLAGEAVLAHGGAESPLRLGLPAAVGQAAAAALLDRAAAAGFVCALAAADGGLLVAGWIDGID